MCHPPRVFFPSCSLHLNLKSSLSLLFTIHSFLCMSQECWTFSLLHSRALIKQGLQALLSHCYSCMHKAEKWLLLGLRICRFFTLSDVNKSICQWQISWQGLSEVMLQHLISVLSDVILWCWNIIIIWPKPLTTYVQKEI